MKGLAGPNVMPYVFECSGLVLAMVSSVDSVDETGKRNYMAQTIPEELQPYPELHPKFNHSCGDGQDPSRNG